MATKAKKSVINKKAPILNTRVEIKTQVKDKLVTNIYKTIGNVISVKDGVAFVTGLPKVRVGEMVEFINKNIFGMALNLEKDRVGCIVFGDDQEIKQDDEVIGLDRLVDVGVGDALLGRVVDGLGILIDGKEDITESLQRKNVERKAPGVITRKTVSEPMLTGYKIVDSMLPIGRGQRELIVGDRQTVKLLSL